MWNCNSPISNGCSGADDYDWRNDLWLDRFALQVDRRVQRIARKAGLADAVMRDLQMAQRPSQMQADERLVYNYCVQLSLNHRVPDALWQEAVDQLGEQAVIDLTVLSGTYVMVSMLLNATQVGIPGGEAEPLQVMDPLSIRQRLLA